MSGGGVKRIVLLLLALVALSGVRPAPARADESITVFLWSAWRTEAWSHIGKWLDGIKEEYEKQYPGMKVEYQYVNWGADPLILAAASGTAPDVSIVSIAYALDLYEKGLLLPLNTYWSKSPVGRLGFFPSARIYNRRGEDIFGAPWSMEATTIVYNAEMFEKTGLDPDPDAIGSWDQLVATGKKLHRISPDGMVTVAGFNSGLSLPSFAAWVYANGGQVYNKDFTAVAFDGRQGREALDFLSQLYTFHRLNGPGSLAQFHAGTVAMMMYQIPAGALLSDAPFRSAQTDLPPGPSGQKRSTVGWSNMYVIPKGAKHPDLGWKWIELMLSQPQQDKLIAGFGHPIAPYREAYNSPLVEQAVRRLPYIANTPRILTDAGAYPFVRYSEVNSVVQPLLTKVSRGELAPGPALSEIVRLTNNVLAPAR